MALKGALIWLCSLAVWVSSAAQDETSLQNCSSQKELWERLSVAVECAESLPWSSQQTAALLLSMTNLTDALHAQQLRECRGVEPEKCPQAEVPDNGGLACVTVDNKRYCKPLCNHGFDFGFMRRSRLYDECSEQTGFRWNTQFVGGNRLAVCNEASIQVSGAKTAYFPQDQDCLKTKSSSHQQNSIIEDFKAELKSQGLQGELQHACLLCG
ncbi:uncharacterized protein [Chaetodon trifascialis]|uniref:uncharacterized protein n=1 Tax=Chaetodon trifascialis TaxID=109706 RepID=UPI003992C752